TGGATTITVTGEPFPNTAANKPYVTVTDSAQVFNLDNVSGGAGGRISVTDQTEIAFDGNANGDVNERFIVTWSVKTPGGTAIENARVKITESAPSAAIANQNDTNSSGAVSSTYLRALYEPSGATTITTTTHTPNAFKVYKYAYLPFVSSATIDQPVTQNVAMLTDTFKDPGTDEATAVSDGTDKVVFVESLSDAQSHSIIKVTNITGNAFAAGNVLTGGTSGASGTIEEIIEGTGAIGTDATIILKLRNSTAFLGTEAINRTGGGSSTLVSASEKRFYWLVQAGTISSVKRTLQQLYDHFNAKMAEATLDSADNWDKVATAGRAEFGIPIQGVSLGSPNSFKTIRNEALTRGWVISGLNSLGGLSAYTANDGTSFVPAVTVTVQLTNVVVDSRCTIFETANPSNVIMLTTAATSTVSVQYVWTGDLGITIRVRKSSTAPKYLPYEAFGTITNTNFSLAVNQIADAIA
ncbi:MAG: hypothetical protein C0410_16100, partial [Anaerolinea sp.]|nr:hypothetical protein [Anaerolinea sp.]